MSTEQSDSDYRRVDRAKGPKGEARGGSDAADVAARLRVGAGPMDKPWEATSAQQRAIGQVLGNLARLTAKSHKSKGPSGFYDRPHEQFFFIEGERGSGKTSTILTLHKLLDDRPGKGFDLQELVAWNKGLFCPEEENRKTNHSNDLNPDIHTLRQRIWKLSVQPSALGDNERLMQRLFGAALNRLTQLDEAEAEEESLASHEGLERKRRVEVTSTSIGSRLDLVNQLRREIFANWTHSEGRAADVAARDAVDYQDYGAAQADTAAWSERRVSVWRRWIDALLKHLERDLMLIIVDDMDVEGTRTEDLIQSLRQYLDHPRIAVVLCGSARAMRIQLDAHQYARAVRSLGINQLREDLRERFDSQMADEAMELFPKVISPGCTYSITLTPAQLVQELPELRKAIISDLDPSRYKSEKLRQWVEALQPEDPTGPLYRLCTSRRDLISLVTAARAHADQEGERALDDFLSGILSLPSLVGVRDLRNLNNEQIKTGFIGLYLSRVRDTEDPFSVLNLGGKGSGIALTDTPEGQFFLLALKLANKEAHESLVEQLSKRLNFENLDEWLSPQIRSFLESLHAPRLLHLIPAWQAPANLSEVQDWVELVKLRKFSLLPKYKDIWRQLKDAFPEVRRWTKFIEKGAVISANLFPDTSADLQRVTLVSLAEFLSGSADFEPIADARLSSRTIAAWALWKYSNSNESLEEVVWSEKQGVDHFWLPESQRTRLISGDSISVRYFWTYVFEYLRADLLRVVIGDVLAYQLWSSLVIHRWRLQRVDSSGGKIARFQEFTDFVDEWASEDHEITEFSDSELISAALRINEAWQACVVCLDVWMSNPKEPQIRFPWEHYDFLRASLRPVAALIKLNPRYFDEPVLSAVYDDLMQLSYALQAWFDHLLTNGQFPKLKALRDFHGRLEEFNEELVDLVQEIARALTPWAELSDAERVQRLNPFELWPDLESRT